jgi:hypothetical protein
MNVCALFPACIISVLGGPGGRIAECNSLRLTANQLINKLLYIHDIHRIVDDYAPKKLSGGAR